MLTKALEMVAELMALSARTAPKARGQDSLIIRVVVGEDLKLLAQEMRRLGEARGAASFIRDAGNMEQSQACLLLASSGADVAGLNCSACGCATCQEMLEAQGLSPKEKPFRGPNCAMKMADLGIALGSAAKTASLHNADNRIMFSAGASALSLGWLEGCNVAYAIPLQASGKSIYFDRR
jgi:uncharacterized ferredoxin-like protein